MSEHLGYDRHDPAGCESGNSRNGTRSKTVLTEIGPVEIEVPRDRDASFDPIIVRKRQRRLDGIDEIVLSLTARGLTTGEGAAHVDELYGAKVSRVTISRITDKVVEETITGYTVDRTVPDTVRNPTNGQYSAVSEQGNMMQGHRRAAGLMVKMTDPSGGISATAPILIVQCWSD